MVLLVRDALHTHRQVLRSNSAYGSLPTPPIRAPPSGNPGSKKTVAMPSSPIRSYSIRDAMWIRMWTLVSDNIASRLREYAWSRIYSRIENGCAEQIRRHFHG